MHLDKLPFLLLQYRGIPPLPPQDTLVIATALWNAGEEKQQLFLMSLRQSFQIASDFHYHIQSQVYKHLD